MEDPRLDGNFYLSLLLADHKAALELEAHLTSQGIHPALFEFETIDRDGVKFSVECWSVKGLAQIAEAVEAYYKGI